MGGSSYPLDSAGGEADGNALYASDHIHINGRSVDRDLSHNNLLSLLEASDLVEHSDGGSEGGVGNGGSLLRQSSLGGGLTALGGLPGGGGDVSSPNKPGLGGGRGGSG